MAVYESSRKNPWIGVGLAYVFPTAGHFYANDWGRGLKFVIVEAIGIGLILNADTYDKRTCTSDGYYSSYDDCYDEKVYNEDQVVTGATIYFMAKVWELFDAYRAVEDYNTNLKEGLELSHGFDPYYNMTVGLTYRF